MTSALYLPTFMVEGGTTPRAVCARHGLPASGTRRVKLYSRSPWWVWVLMLASILVALVIAVALRKVVLAPAWPFCVRCEDRRRGMVLGVVGSVVAMVLGIVLASVTGELWFLALTGLGIVPALLFGSFAGWAAVAGAHVAQDRASVVVPRPAPRYVAALPPHPSAAHRVRQ